MPSEKKAILLRIPPDLWERLNHWAADDLRSLNGQIEYLLRQAVRRRYGGDDSVRGETVDPADDPPSAPR